MERNSEIIELSWLHLITDTATRVKHSCARIFLWLLCVLRTQLHLVMTMRCVQALRALSPEAAGTTLAAAATTLSLRVPLRVRFCSVFDGNQDQGLDELLVDIVGCSSSVVVEETDKLALLKTQ